MVGWTHDSRLHFASTSGRVQRISYMFAVGPPMSLMMPANSGSAAIFLTSPRIDSCERDRCRPRNEGMAQNPHFRSQPSATFT